MYIYIDMLKHIYICVCVRDLSRDLCLDMTFCLWMCIHLLCLVFAPHKVVHNDMLTFLYFLTRLRCHIGCVVLLEIH